MSENKIEIYSRESENHVCWDVHARFLDQDIIIESFTHSNLTKVGPAVAAFQAVAEDVFLILGGDDLAQVIVRNDDDSDCQPFLGGAPLAKKVEATLKKMAFLPA